MNVKILDCTLRDGGYINNWEFDKEDTLNTVNTLLESNIDIIECGFLDDIGGSESNSTRFKSFNIANNHFVGLHPNKNQLIVAMIEHGKYDIDSLPHVDKRTKIKGIRYSFRKSDLYSVTDRLSKIKEKGYQLFIQPISTGSYTDEELIAVLDMANNINPYAIYIVDTQGSMFTDTFERIYTIFNNRLNKKIIIGFHSHNNMLLSYAIAIEFINLSKKRKIVIDSSVYGMGRGAGNLNTELIIDYINKKNGQKYKTEGVLELIDNYYYFMHKKYQWGYSLAHFLSASLECHPDYSSYLLNKKHLSINEIKFILSKIEAQDSSEYKQKIIEKLYFQYNLSKHENYINEPRFNGKDILLFGPGSSIKLKIGYVRKNRHLYNIIALNHIPSDIKADYVFFSTKKRFEKFKSLIETTPVITSSNFSASIPVDYTLDYEKISLLGNNYNDNSAIMLMNYLSQNNISHVYVMGVDGFETEKNNYYYKESDSIVDNKAIKSVNSSILQGLKILSKKINIHFITDSIFKNQF